MTGPAGRTEAADRAVILCVEDEDDLRSDLVEELEEAGYAVMEAGDGAQAAARLDAVRPDLILCDINMPGRNGYDLLHDLRRQRPELADVPFVFLTALADPREVVKGKRAGADDYLVKPVDFDLMLATIETRLRQVARIRHRARAEIDRLRGALGELRDREAEAGFHAACRALDYVALGVVLLDAGARVLFANRAARALAAEADGLTIGEALLADGARPGAGLRRTLETALAMSLAGEDHVAGLSVPRPSGRRDLLLLACSLDARGRDGAHAPAVVAFISDPERRPQVPGDVLAALFGLTPAESQVAIKLAEGRRLDEIATSLHVSQTTVAYHLRNLFQKTDTHRQADLMALVLAGPMTMSFD